MIGYVSTECQWNSRTLVSSLSDSLRPTLPFTRVISLRLMLGEDQLFLLLVIDSG
jgi:hypothetical protein